jgi:peptidoglycan/xylan/chitin deacetylase (PgdA/CDA1 family)
MRPGPGAAVKGRNLPSGSRFLQRLALELAYFGGYAHLKRPRRDVAGVVLRFERVRPRRAVRFQPLEASEITPEFLDGTLSALRHWDFEIVSIEEACRRAVTLAAPRRFVCLTFDGGYRDLLDWAYPVLSRHRAPFVLYVPTAFPDGVGEIWWLALEAVIAHERHLSLLIDRKELHFAIAGEREKYQLYDFLHRWMRLLSPSDLSTAIGDLCRRYSVDLAALSREAVMNWEDLARLAADPSVTIGTATVNYPALARLKDDDALREMTMGRAVAQSALRREVRHFAFPYGDRAAFGRQHVALAAQAGFASAVSTFPGAVATMGQTALHELPRIAWDGRLRSLRAMRVMLSSAMSRPARAPRI